MSMMIAAMLSLAAAPNGDAKADDAPRFRIVTAPSATAAPSLTAAPQPMTSAVLAFDMASATHVGRQWGTVTSTFRSPEHNRRVGGARNSHHLRNRAIDIARRPGVSHRQIDAAFRAAGYRLIESLDEGDHSHFAFADAPAAPARPIATIVGNEDEPTRWRVVFAPKRD